MRGLFGFGGSMNIFDRVAKEWDSKTHRVETARKIGEVIVSSAPVSKDWVVLDFGAGTGLLTFFLAPFVSKVYALDNSKGMFEVLKEKVEKLGASNVEPVLGSYDKVCLGEPVDLIVSSMSLHHVREIQKLFNWFSSVLNPEGFVAVADLVKEDGSFHSDNTGVYHFGFEREELERYMRSAGIEPLEFKVIFSIKKSGREYPVFLSIGRKV